MLGKRYGTRVGSWWLPTSQVKRKQLADVYGTDAVALLSAVYGPDAAGWLRINSPSDTDTRWAAKGKDLAWSGYKVHLSETCHTDDTDTAHTRDDAEAGQQRDVPVKPMPDELPNLITNVAPTDATVGAASRLPEQDGQCRGRIRAKCATRPVPV